MPAPVATAPAASRQPLTNGFLTQKAYHAWFGTASPGSAARQPRRRENRLPPFRIE